MTEYFLADFCWRVLKVIMNESRCKICRDKAHVVFHNYCMLSLKKCIFYIGKAFIIYQ